MQERIPETIEARVVKIVEEFGFEKIEGNLDLRQYLNEEVIKFLYTLKDTGLVVFHGTNSEERFDTLHTRQANDSAKESGNKKAVYADAGIIAPLGLAILNRLYVRSKFRGFVFGWTSDDKGKRIFKLSSNIFELFKSKDPNLFSDGYLYALDKSRFSNAEDAGAEWHSETDQKPILSCRVSRNLAETVFVINQGEEDTVFEYTPEEIKDMAESPVKKDSDV